MPTLGLTLPSQNFTLPMRRHTGTRLAHALHTMPHLASAARGPTKQYQGFAISCTLPMLRFTTLGGAMPMRFDTLPGLASASLLPTRLFFAVASPSCALAMRDSANAVLSLAMPPQCFVPPGHACAVPCAASPSHRRGSPNHSDALLSVASAKLGSARLCHRCTRLCLTMPLLLNSALGLRLALLFLTMLCLCFAQLDPAKPPHRHTALGHAAP